MALMWNRTVDWTLATGQVAACRDTEPDLFFPVGTTAVPSTRSRRPTVCRSCDAQEPCLEFALATNQESASGRCREEERRKLRKSGSPRRRHHRRTEPARRLNSWAGWPAPTARPGFPSPSSPCPS